MKNKHLSQLICVLLVLTMVLSGCGKIDIESYSKKVKDLSAQLEYVSAALGNMGSWEANFLKALGKSSDQTVDRAYSWLEENSDYTQKGLEQAHEQIMGVYSAISEETKGEEETAIFEQLTVLYNDYLVLHDIVINDPSYSNVASNLLDAFKTVYADIEAMDECLK